MNDRPLADGHEALLKTALKLGANDPLPPEIIKNYWEVVTTMRRLGENVGTKDLAWIVLRAGASTPPTPLTFLDVVSRGGVKPNGRILARFRNDWEFGRFKRVRGKKVIATLDATAHTERELSPTEVRLPLREELVAIGE